MEETTTATTSEDITKSSDSNQVMKWLQTYKGGKFNLKKLHGCDGEDLLGYTETQLCSLCDSDALGMALYNTLHPTVTTGRVPTAILPKEEDIWLYTVYISIDGGDDCTGILIRSQTKPENMHLLVNLHSFQEQSEKGTKLPYPIRGFPNGYDSEFKFLTETKQKRPKDTSDPVQIRIFRLSISINKEGRKAEQIEPLYSTKLAKEDIIYCSGKLDALVLFDMEFPGMNVAPISVELKRRDQVHMYGFTHMNKKSPPLPFIVPGEIMTTQGSTIYISGPSSPGLSGGAVVLDDTGGVIAYVGGGWEGTDFRSIGSYAIAIGPLFQVVEEKDKQFKKRKQNDDDEDEDEDKKLARKN